MSEEAWGFGPFSDSEIDRLRVHANNVASTASRWLATLDAEKHVAQMLRSEIEDVRGRLASVSEVLLGHPGAKGTEWDVDIARRVVAENAALRADVARLTGLLSDTREALAPFVGQVDGMTEEKLASLVGTSTIVPRLRGFAPESYIAARAALAATAGTIAVTVAGLQAHARKAEADAARLAAALRALLADLSEAESNAERFLIPSDPGCRDCTQGVPAAPNTGPCPRHAAERLLMEVAK